MRILVSAKYLYPFHVGGAEISLDSLIKELSRKHEVFVVCAGNEDATFQRNKVTIIRKKILNKIFGFNALINLLNFNKWKKIVYQQIQYINPDLILTQLDFAAPTVLTADRFKILNIIFLRSYEHFCPNNFFLKDYKECDKKCCNCFSPFSYYLLRFFIKRMFKSHEIALKKCNLVIANSNYMSSVCKTIYGVKSEIVYPFIVLKNYVSDNKYFKKSKITFMGNGFKHKGIDILMKIAFKMPTYNFQVVGDFNSTFSKYKFLLQESKYRNIEYFKTTNDMRNVYANTKILLVPSLWQEPFGRVCIEAMANGVPCIVSNKGGLPESLGDCGIVIDNPFDINAWIKAIQRLMNDQALYEELVRKSRERAQQFDFSTTYQHFLSIVNGKLSLNEIL